MSHVTSHPEGIPEGAQPITAETISVAISEENPKPVFVPPAAKSYEPWPSEASFELPDGRMIVMKPPRVLSRMQNAIMAETKLADPLMLQLEVVAVNALLFVYSIDGEVVMKPQNAMEREALEQRIGIRFMDLITQKYAEAFPPIDSNGIQLIKK